MNNIENILIRKYIDGDTAISYNDGKKCQKDILRTLDKGDAVSLDFDGINYVITAFLNPIIGDLILERGKGIMKSIGIVNANESIIKKIKLVRDGTLMKREDLEE